MRVHRKTIKKILSDYEIKTSKVGFAILFPRIIAYSQHSRPKTQCENVCNYALQSKKKQNKMLFIIEMYINIMLACM